MKEREGEREREKKQRTQKSDNRFDPPVHYLAIEVIH